MLTLDLPTQANLLGFLALFSYIATLLPTILRIVLPSTKETGIPLASEILEVSPWRGYNTTN
jgi:sulfoxide reductase heme-binding subunit YedZ